MTQPKPAAFPIPAAPSTTRNPLKSRAGFTRRNDIPIPLLKPCRPVTCKEKNRAGTIAISISGPVFGRPGFLTEH